MAKGMKLPGGMQNMLKQAQRMQEELKKAQEEAKNMIVEASAGGGMVKAVANGSNQLVSIEISKEVVDPDDIEMLQDLVVAAVNEAMNKVMEAVQEAVSRVTGGLNIPGL